jgi:hypothetical protein
MKLAGVRSALTVVLNLVIGVALFGQTQVMISPIPAWPPDGTIPDSLKNNYVFLGPSVREITVSYPASLEDPSQTGRKTFTLELHNQVEPTLSVRIAQDPNGVYVYDYVLGNAQSAKQAIRLWSFTSPANDLAARRPSWSSNVVPGTQTRQSALATAAQRGVLFYAGSGNEIQPGSSLDGFQVVSTYSPGFTMAFVRSGAAFVLPSEVPTPVGDQIGALATSGFDSQVVVVLGPKLPPESSVQAIAADFHIGITRLIRSGKLNGDSSFIKEMLTGLGRFVEAGATSTLADLVKSLPKPSPGVESEIATALQLSSK